MPNFSEADLARILENGARIEREFSMGLKLPPANTAEVEGETANVANRSGGSPLEERFISLWQTYGGPDLQPEYKFHATRRWRLDFYEPNTKTAIEIEGGTWSGGRHVRGKGYEGDCEKYNAATMQGIRVIRLTSGMVNGEYVRRIIAWILGDANFGS